jgi:hypothetical protein
MTMRKLILNVLSASLIAVLSAQSADAASRHHARSSAGAIERFHQANAHVAPASSDNASQASRYSRGWSAPAGH